MQLQKAILQYIDNHPTHEGVVVDVMQKHIINTIFRQSRGLAPLMDYFLMDGIEDTNLHYYRDMVEELAFVDLWVDKTGGRPLYFKDMFGLSIKDLYQLDYKTFSRYYDKALAMKERFTAAAAEHAAELDKLNDETKKSV